MELPARDVGWSLRAHLITIAALLTVAFVAGAGYLWSRDVDRARDEATRDTHFQAGLAAEDVLDSLALVQTIVASGATAPDTPALIADPSSCQIAADGIGVFSTIHMDIVRPDGSVACSSLARQGAPPGATHEGTTWLAELSGATEPLVSGPLIDRLTDRQSVIVGAPILSGEQFVGSVVIVLSVEDLGPSLAREYGGPERLSFTVVDPGRGVVLSDSTRRAAERPLRGTSFAAGHSGTWAGFDGVRRVHHPASVEGLGWQVFAGADESRYRAVVWDRAVEGARTWAIAIVILILLVFAVNRRIVRPLRKVTDAVVDAGREPMPRRVNVKGPTEVRRLARAFNETLEARADYEARLTFQALHDPLTGLPNRTLLADRLELSLQRSRRDGSKVAVLFLDLDRFKLVNDSMGHEVGDRVLTVIASRLGRLLRPGDTIARFGGDEFVIIAEGLAHGDEAVDIAERVTAALRPPVTLDDTTVTVTASIGITVTDGQRTGTDALLREADAAMYRAKENGRSCYELFDETLRARAAVRLEIESELRAALERGELDVHYQPTIGTASGDIERVEALVRWRHPVRGMIPPLDFLAVAEETGLILPVGRFVLDEACRAAAVWRDAGRPLRVSVNVSAQQLSRGDLPSVVEGVLARHGLPADMLTLEITEHELVDMRAIDELTELRDKGVRISLDDFGTGYSSLSYIRRLPINEIKIDRAFVSVLGEDPGAEAIVDAVVAMASSLGLDVVAEGVETLEQYDAVVRLGCGSAQGFLLGKPVPAWELSNLLVDRAFARA